jgi:putative ABC transport system permease protein
MKPLNSNHNRASGLPRDFRQAARALARRPGFTAAAALTLALGVGASTIIFSAVNGILLRPLPYKDADRLVRIHGNFELLKMRNMGVRPREFLDYQDMNNVFDGSAALQVSDFNVTGQDQADQPEKLRGAFVSDGLFQLLGFHQQAGRLFNPDEYMAGRDKAAVISDGLWSRRYGRSPVAIGKDIVLNGAVCTVVGVMPRGLEFRHLATDRSEPFDLWLPLALTQDDLEHGGWFLDVIGRLKQGVTLEQARADIGLIANGFIDRYHQYKGPHGEDGGWRTTLFPLKDEEVGDFRSSLMVLLASVGVLLLIACANVANLVLMRGLGRKRELAIRTALGAGAVRVFRQLLIENFMIAALGATTGLLVAYWARDLLQAIGAESIPRLDEVGLDIRVLGFCVALSTLTPILFGLLPALKLSRVNLADSLKQGERSAGGSHNRLRAALVVAEVALSLMLLIWAGLLMKSFIGLQHVDLGFNPEDVVTARLDLPDSKYGDDRRQSEFFQELLGRLGSAAGAGSSSLFTGAFRDPFSIEGKPFDSANPATAFHLMVGPRYFETLQIALLRGREFTADDSMGSPGVAVINRNLADRFFGDQDPLGREIKVGAPGSGQWLTIIGVAGDARDRGPALPAEPVLYMAYSQAPIASAILAVRYAGTLDQASESIRREVVAIDRDQPVYRIQTFKTRLAGSVAEPRLDAMLFSFFSLIALALAIVGIYVVLSYTVSQRINEIGIRMAVGAKGADIARLVIRQGLGLTVAGISAGIIGALLSARLLSGLLFSVSATDPWTFVSIPLILAATAFLACLRPALRASRLHPVSLLRQD